MMESDPETRTLSGEEARALREAVDRARTRAFLIVIRGPREGRLFRLDQPVTRIGRAIDCEVRIDDVGVSRRHAVIERRDRRLVIVDQGSRNGTYVDGTRITEMALQDGHRIQLSGVILKVTYQDPLEEDFQRRIYNSVTRDGLTGAYNKEYFQERLKSSVALANRHQSPLSVITFDLDHFKNLNDHFGHPAGDHALRQVSTVVQLTLREEDILARCGGEEFGLILQQTGHETAREVAERLRLAIAEHRFEWDGERMEVSASVGVATLSAELSTPEALIQAADQNLYRAKAGGRNRTVG